MIWEVFRLIQAEDNPAPEAAKWQSKPANKSEIMTNWVSWWPAIQALIQMRFPDCSQLYCHYGHKSPGGLRCTQMQANVT